MNKLVQKIQIIFETEIEVDQEYADYMEMTLEEALAYKINTIKEYPENREDEITNSNFIGIKNVD